MNDFSCSKDFKIKFSFSIIWIVNIENMDFLLERESKKLNLNKNIK